MRNDRYRWGAEAVHVHRPRATEFLGGNREEMISRTCCLPEDAGDEGLRPRQPWWGKVKRGRDSPGTIISQSATDLECPNSELQLSARVPLVTHLSPCPSPMESKLSVSLARVRWVCSLPLPPSQPPYP